MSETTFNVIGVASDAALRAEFAADLRAGFGMPKKQIPSRYFYDAMGSDLFVQIMKMDSYYPTDCETEIFQNRAKELLKTLDRKTSIALVDLGAGDGSKTKLLLSELVDQDFDLTYVPVDISKDALVTLSEKLRPALPTTPIQCVVGVYVDALTALSEDRPAEQLLTLFLGSNIGNFPPEGTVRFLARVRHTMKKGDRMIVGFDLKKDPEIIERAYDDSEGITAAFNLNLLRRINREFHANFDLEAFTHHALYNPHTGAAESFLVSLKEQVVEIQDLEMSVRFEAFEAIQTECSYKYTPEDVRRYAASTGFEVETVVTDSRGYFADAVWVAV